MIKSVDTATDATFNIIKQTTNKYDVCSFSFSTCFFPCNDAQFSSLSLLPRSLYTFLRCWSAFDFASISHLQIRRKCMQWEKDTTIFRLRVSVSFHEVEDWPTKKKERANTHSHALSKIDVVLMAFCENEHYVMPTKKNLTRKEWSHKKSYYYQLGRFNCTDANANISHSPSRRNRWFRIQASPLPCW